MATVNRKLSVESAGNLLRIFLAAVAVAFALTRMEAATARPQSATAEQRGARSISNVEYSRPGGAPLLLDGSIPAGSGPFPTAIIVHGGYWMEGNKTTYIRPLKPLLSGAGFAWFSIDYRLAPQHRYPAAIEDVEAAVRWVRAHAEQYRVDLSRVVLIGEGAGGYLVAMASLEKQTAAGVAAVVDFEGPSDLTVFSGSLTGPPRGIGEFFGITDLSDASLKILQDASPNNLVHKGMPPFLFVHGTADQVVPFVSSPIMCEAMRNVDVMCQLQLVNDAGHGIENWEGKPADETWKPAMIAWLNSTLKMKPRT